MTKAAVVPGCKPIFTGRVINVARGVENGWTIGAATIQRATDDEDDDDDDGWTQVDTRQLELQFQVSTHCLPTLMDAVV
jgi:hypothetical protein